MGEFAPHLHDCHKNGPQHSSEVPAAIFATTVPMENEFTPFRRKEH
jgi:hypothetical protein